VDLKFGNRPNLKERSFPISVRDRETGDGIKTAAWVGADNGLEMFAIWASGERKILFWSKPGGSYFCAQGGRDIYGLAARHPRAEMKKRMENSTLFQRGPWS